MNHKGTKKIETENLILRRFEISDAEAMYNNWASDDEVTKYLTWDSHSSVEVSKDILNIWIDEYNNLNSYNWAITLKEDENNPIGSISVVKLNDEIGIVQLGYCIGQKWWNKGVTSQALNALIKFFIEEVGANRIEARHDPVNINSGKVMLKCGMKFEGTMRQCDRNNQGICDTSMYALLAQDYIRE